MGWFLGIGLVGLGVLLIAGCLLLRGKKDSLPENYVLTSGSAAEIVPELQKLFREGNFKAIDRIVDELNTYPPEKISAVRDFLVESAAVDRYLNDLGERDYKVRAAAVERLGKLGGTRISNALFEAMADRNEEVRMTAAAALKETGDPAVSDRLVEALREPNKWLPARVAEVLVSFGKAALPALHAVVNDSDPIVRGYAVEILGEIGDSSSVEALHKALEDGDGGIRHKAASALGNIAHQESVDVLAKALQDTEIRVRVQAVRSLGSIGGTAASGHLHGIILAGDDMLRTVALDALRQMGPAGLEVIKQADASSQLDDAAVGKVFKQEGISGEAKVNINYK